MFGSYGCTSRPETIAQKNNTNSSHPSEDVARLAGIRFVNIAEPGKSLVLNVALVKNMTGDDTINARFLHENSFDFKPQFKLYNNTNYLPVVYDMNVFASGRVIIIPFERHFAESEQDKGLKREFTKPEVQSAMLNWLIQGYEQLQKHGMRLPQDSTSMTAIKYFYLLKIAWRKEQIMRNAPLWSITAINLGALKTVNTQRA